MGGHRRSGGVVAGERRRWRRSRRSRRCSRSSAASSAERRWGGRARPASLWGFVLVERPGMVGRTGCARAIADRRASRGSRHDWLGPLRPRVGGPGAPGSTGGAAPRRGAPSSWPARPLARGDAAFVAGGALLAAALQLIGWRVGERRASSFSCGSSRSRQASPIIGAAAEVALARHSARVKRSRSRRLRRSMALLVVLALLGLTGVLFAPEG